MPVSAHSSRLCSEVTNRPAAYKIRRVEKSLINWPTKDRSNRQENLHTENKRQRRKCEISYCVIRTQNE